MIFVVRWILREVRSHPRFALLILANFVVSLSCFFLLSNFRTVYHEALSSQGQSLLTADLSISARRHLSNEEKNIAQASLEKFQIESQTSTVDFLSMVTNAEGETRLVQVRAIEDQYPLYGELALRFESVDTGKYLLDRTRDTIEAQPIVWTYEELLPALNLSVGDSLNLGASAFRVAGVIAKDTTQSIRLGSLAPRIFIGKKFLQQTGLTQQGATLTETLLFRTRQAISDDDAKGILLRFSDPAIQVTSTGQAAKEAARGIDYLTDFLSLIGLVALLMSALGTFFLSRSFVEEKTKDIGLLAALGLPHLRIKLLFLFYFFALIGLALIASFAVSLSVQPLMIKLVNDLLNTNLQGQISSSSAFSVVGVALFVGLIVLWPALAAIDRVKISILLRGESNSPIQPDRSTFAYLSMGLIFFFLLSLIQTHSFQTASLFVACIVGIAVFTYLLTLGGFKFLNRISRNWHWQIRWVLLSISRRSRSTLVTLVALTTGVFLTGFIPLLAGQIQSDIAPSATANRPSLFLFDIQEDQIEQLKAIAREVDLHVDAIAPLIRARILEVNGKPFEKIIDDTGPETREKEVEARFRNRGFNLSIRDTLYASEELIRGQPMDGAKTSPYQVSVEKKFADRLGWKVGDILDFDVQGQRIAGKIMNLRKVNWTSFQPNFFIIFQSETPLDKVQKIYLANVNQADIKKIQTFQRKVFQVLPNISAVDLNRAVATFLEILNQIKGALQISTLLTLLAGLIVVASITVQNAARRARDRRLLGFLGVSGRRRFILGLSEAGFFMTWSLLIGLSLSTIAVNVLFQYILK